MLFVWLFGLGWFALFVCLLDWNGFEESLRVRVWGSRRTLGRAC